MILGSPEPKNLEEWLEMATKGIVPPGRERVREEIRAHYAEAVEAHIAQGEPEEVAQENALLQLGDAKTARRRFRMQHFTVEEENWAAGFRSRNDSKTALATNFFLGLFVMLLSGGEDEPTKQELFICWLAFLGLIVCPTVVFFMLRMPAMKSKTSCLPWVDFIQRGFLGSAGLIFCMAMPGENGFPGAFCIAQFVRAGIFAFQTTKKFRKNGSSATAAPELPDAR